MKADLDTLRRWTSADTCTPRQVEGLDHARWTLDRHAEHRCPMYWVALGHSSKVIG
ncbi:hypothetical protein [Nocardia callitridis]|uniref:hypothetical protein n=1 Tax=Nocardia callitridis TaxID=648753 RepID=UPI0031ED6ABE